MDERSCLFLRTLLNADLVLGEVTAEGQASFASALCFLACAFVISTKKCYVGDYKKLLVFGKLGRDVSNSVEASGRSSADH